MDLLKIILLLPVLAAVPAAWFTGCPAIYLAVVSVTAFAAFGLDKYCACRNRSRFPEAYLLLLAAIGGGAASLAAMWIFRHKTRKMKFRVLALFFTALQLTLLLWSSADRRFTGYNSVSGKKIYSVPDTGK